MKTIPLTQGKFAIVDDDDYQQLIKFNWCVCHGYAIREEKKKRIYMHRIVNKTPNGFITDHINGNKIDNRKSNLKTANSQTNGFNRGKNKNNSSGYKGVTWHNQLNKWIAQAQVNYKHKFLGSFEDKKDAAKAYNDFVLKHFNKFTKLNEL